MYGNLRDWILLSSDTNAWEEPDVWYAAEGVRSGWVGRWENLKRKDSSKGARELEDNIKMWSVRNYTEII
jgi:hypothetical protein